MTNRGESTPRSAWPYTDLRFVIPLGDPPARLHVRVVDDHVELQVWGEAAVDRQVALTAVDDGSR